MNSRIGCWQIGTKGPRQLSRNEVSLESKLEDWIERDPSLLRAGLTIVARQLNTDGGPLDLLAIGLQGRWVVIEIKRRWIRRETVGQAIDYASCIRKMPEPQLCAEVTEYLRKARRGSLQKLREQHPEAFGTQPGKREVEIIVVGTDRDSGLERMVGYVQESNKLSISAITFDVFTLPTGQQVLVRELTESDEFKEASPGLTIHRETALCRHAESIGIGEQFAQILKLADQYGLKKRVTNKSIMFAPPSDGRRVLFLVYGAQLARNGGMLVYAFPPAFKEFLDIKASFVLKALGVDGWAGLDTEKRKRGFVKGLELVLKKAKTRSLSEL